MSRIENSDDHQPLTWWGRVPIYAATILVMVHCATMIIFALLAPTPLGWLLESWIYASSEVMHGQVWRLVTYAFAHDIAVDGWMFLIQMAMLYWFGKEVESYLGRRNFLMLYGSLLLAVPVFLTLLAVFGVSSILSGSSALHFAIFVSFAAIYPTAEMFFGIQSRWIAAIFLALNSLICISSQQWTQLSVLWLSCGAAILILRRMGVYSLQFGLPGEAVIQSTLKRAKLVRAPKAAKAKPTKTKAESADVDAILDKIARHGISSLSAAERKSLEQERETLLQKERQR